MEVYFPVIIETLEANEGLVLVTSFVAGKPWPFWTKAESVLLDRQPLIQDVTTRGYSGWVKGTIHSQSMGFTFVEVGDFLIPVLQDRLRENFDIKVNRRIEG